MKKKLKFNRIEEIKCQACGRDFTITPKTKIIGEEEKSINVSCPNCGHVERVLK